MPAGAPTSSIADWNSNTRRVMQDLRPGKFVNAETCLLFAGPPRVRDIGGVVPVTEIDQAGQGTLGVASATGVDALYPIGTVENFSMQQTKAVQKAYEIGSKLPTQGGGRVQIAGAMGKVLFHGPNALRACYAYYPGTVQLANGRSLGPGSPDSVSRNIVGAGDGVAGGIWPDIYLEPGSATAQDPETGLTHSFYCNLMSDLFDQGFGLGVIMRDNRKLNYAAFMMEDCMVTSHSLAFNSSSTLLTESVTFSATTLTPMEFSTDVGPVLAAVGQAG